MFLDDDNLPILPEWEAQIKQLDTIKEAETAAKDETSSAATAQPEGN